MSFHEHHTFSSGTVRVAYDIEKMAFYRLSEEEWRNAQQVNICLEHKPSPATVPSEKVSPAPSGKRPLKRLVMIVTTRCNLRCRYCYAEGGDYGMPQLLMPTEIAYKALDWVFEHFSSLETIQFFGGEPSLNASLIEAVCQEIDNRIDAGEIGQTKRPRYGMVTNGVHLNSHLEDIIERYQIHLTYSIDGPAKVHDYHRIRIGGNGSFRSAMANFQKLQSRGDTSLATEMTLTPEAIKAGYGVWELAKFSAEELQLLEPHIVPVFTEPGMPVAQWDEESAAALIESYRQATISGLNALMNGHLISFSLLSNMLQTLILRRKHKFICPAGIGTLAVDPNGDIYPCFMFAGQPTQTLTNVLAYDSANFRERLSNFSYTNDKENRLHCHTCWARHLCSSCIGNHNHSSNSLTQEWDLTCQIVKVIAEETMLFLASIREQPEAWEQFVLQYKRFRMGG